MQRVASRERVSRRISWHAMPRGAHGLVRLASRCLAAVAPIFAFGAGAADESIDLMTYEIETGHAQRQVVVTGSLLGGRVADIAVISSDESGKCQLRVFAGDASWQLQIDTPLPGAIEFVDVAHIGDRDRLLIYRRGQLTWFNPEQDTERPLLSAVVRYRQLLPNRVSHVDVARDVTGDGRDDLLLPDRDAFQVFVQRRDGTFAEPVTIGPSPGFRRLYEVNGYRYDPWAHGRVYELDYNHDGRPDLAYWNDDHFAVHLQRAPAPTDDAAGLDGHFSSRAETFATTVPFDADELAYFAAGTWDFDDASELQGRVFDGFADFDNDGTADLAIATVAGDSLFAKHTTYEVPVVPTDTPPDLEAQPASPATATHTPDPVCGQSVGCSPDSTAPRLRPLPPPAPPATATWTPSQWSLYCSLNPCPATATATPTATATTTQTPTATPTLTRPEKGATELHEWLPTVYATQTAEAKEREDAKATADAERKRLAREFRCWQEFLVYYCQLHPHWNWCTDTRDSPFDNIQMAGFVPSPECEEFDFSDREVPPGAIQTATRTPTPTPPPPPPGGPSDWNTATHTPTPIPPSPTPTSTHTPSRPGGPDDWNTATHTPTPVPPTSTPTSTHTPSRPGGPDDWNTATNTPAPADTATNTPAPTATPTPVRGGGGGIPDGSPLPLGGANATPDHRGSGKSNPTATPTTVPPTATATATTAPTATATPRPRPCASWRDYYRRLCDIRPTPLPPPRPPDACPPWPHPYPPTPGWCHGGGGGGGGGGGAPPHW